MGQIEQHYSKTSIAALLMAGSFIAILNQTLMITAIPPIMKEMHITANTGQWLTTVFMLVNGIMIPVTAFLIERFSTRQLFISAMSIFAFGTLVAGLAPNFGILLLGRIIQSSGAGILLPLMQTVFLLIFPIQKRGAAMGLVGLVISFAPAIGPTLSGWIIASHSWRWLFFIILPIALVDIVIAVFAMRNVTELSKPKVDVLSITLSSIGFGGLLYGFTSAGNNGWSNAITVVSLAVGTVTLVSFIVRQLRMKLPMLEFRVLKFDVFTLSTVLAMIGFIGLIGTETLIPLYMQSMRGFTPMQSGLVILPGAIAMGIMSPFTGRVFDRIGARWLCIIGMVIVTGATWIFSNLTTSVSFTFIAVIYSIRTFGLTMVMMPATTAGLNQLPRRLIPHGNALGNTMRQVAASIGTAILVTIMTTTEKSAALGKHFVNPGIHGVNVAFAIVTVLSLIGVVLSIFIRRVYPSEEESAQEEMGTTAAPTHSQVSLDGS